MSVFNSEMCGVCFVCEANRDLVLVPSENYAEHGHKVQVIEVCRNHAGECDSCHELVPAGELGRGYLDGRFCSKCYLVTVRDHAALTRTEKAELEAEIAVWEAAENAIKAKAVAA